MPKVSVIIPVYNVEKYLRECLDSVVNQTLKDIEIICVDDGATDASGEILDEYAAKDNRIKVIHKENGGYGKAMNVGLDNATGEYIGIVEPDDYVELDMFETLYNKAIEYDVDFVKGNYIKFVTNDKSKEELCIPFDKTNIYNKVVVPIEAPKVFQGAACIWSAIYKHKFLKKHNIRFLETPGASFQDTSFWTEVLFEARRALFIENAFNHYRTGNENQSVKSNSKVFCICDELHSLEKRYFNNLYFLKIINALKIDKYTWNYNRLNNEGRNNFIDVYVSELSKIIENKNYESLCVSKEIVNTCNSILQKADKIKISIIIPIYNSENYLEQCLNSVLNQTLKNIEIICIDDCSTDNSLNILEEYAHKDNRIKVISLKENIKQGGARNRGLDIAKGEFITFVDSDDYLEANAIEELLLAEEKYNADIVLANVSNYSTQTIYDHHCKNFEIYYNRLTKETGVYNFNGDFTSYRSGPVAKLFKKSIIDKYRIRFPENLINEDEAFHWMYFSHINTVCYLNKILYHRQLHENSTMIKRDIANERVLDIIFILEIICQYLTKQKKLKKYRIQFSQFYNSQKKETLQRCENDELTLKEALIRFKNLEKKYYFLAGYNSPLEKLFSIKNTPSRNRKWYKTLTILGLKFNIRNKKKEENLKQEELYNNEKEDCNYFIESDREQAKKIASLTGKQVICVETDEYFCGE